MKENKPGLGIAGFIELIVMILLAIFFCVFYITGGIVCIAFLFGLTAVKAALVFALIHLIFVGYIIITEIKAADKENF